MKSPSIPFTLKQCIFYIAFSLALISPAEAVVQAVVPFVMMLFGTPKQSSMSAFKATQKKVDEASVSGEKLIPPLTEVISERDNRSHQ